MNADTELLKSVVDHLALESAIDASNIAIAVKEGIVSLMGTVHSHAEKVLVETRVKEIPGVRGIAEDLRVNPPDHHRRTDLEIAEAALNILRWDIMVPAEKIQVKVEHGWLTLFGEVPWFFQREAAERALQNLTYIKGINNKIAVMPEHKPRDLHQPVERALRTHTNPALRGVTFDIHDQTVTLHGTLQRWRDREDASRAVWNVPGVREVINIIEVAPPGR